SPVRVEVEAPEVPGTVVAGDDRISPQATGGHHIERAVGGGDVARVQEGTRLDGERRRRAPDRDVVQLDRVDGSQRTAVERAVALDGQAEQASVGADIGIEERTGRRADCK